jgi:hypothetical protein
MRILIADDHTAGAQAHLRAKEENEERHIEHGEISYNAG